MVKTCNVCAEEQNINNFSNYKRSKDGHSSRCKRCCSLNGKLYRQNNKEKRKLYDTTNKLKIKAYQAEYYLSNIVELKEEQKLYRQKNIIRIRENDKLYAKINRKIINAKTRFRRKTNAQYKISVSLRNRLNSAIDKKFKAGSAVRDMGCSIRFLMGYLEVQFKTGMSWENYGHSGWHIDHIRPLASFDLTDRNQLLEACHFTNLQPLWAADNIRKGNKLQ